MQFNYQHAAKQEWSSARTKALWSQISAFVQRKDNTLVNFAEVSERLNLRNPRYRGLQDVPLDQIVGSVGRYHDFTNAFFPKTRKMEERWANIATMYLNPAGRGVPPVELYKVGSSYFVKDGNHRVSVARQLDIPQIEAYVWEYPEPVDGIVNSDFDIDTLLIEAEKQDFLKFTNLDDLRPQHGIHLTEPGGYRELIRHILDYQQALNQIDAEDRADPDNDITETVTAWYDMVYEPTIRIIQQENAMEHFPDRSAADLFVYTRRELERLENLYGHRVAVDEVVQTLEAKESNRVSYWWRMLRGIFGRRIDNP